MIKFSLVTKHFPPNTNAVDGISFEIDHGELVLLTGPSGSGKTTIMKLLTREYVATSGNIYFADENLNKINNSKIHDHRRKIGVVFQDYKLLPELNVWENIALPLSIVGKKQKEIEQRVTDLLTLVSLRDKAFLFPKQLSGGEAQRISIARALSTGPSVIFADEPTGNLDQKTSLEIGQLIKKINSLGTTVIFATHDRDIMDLLTEARHINIDRGRIINDSKKKKSKIKIITNENDNQSKITKNKKPNFWSRIFKKKSIVEKANEKKENSDVEVDELNSETIKKSKKTKTKKVNKKQKTKKI